MNLDQEIVEFRGIIRKEKGERRKKMKMSKEEFKKELENHNLDVNGFLDLRDALDRHILSIEKENSQ